MQQVKKIWKQWEDWSTRPGQMSNLAVSVGACWLLAFVCFVLAQWLPAQATKTQLATANTTIAAAQVQLDFVQNRYKGEQQWFAPQYRDGMESKLAKANRWLQNEEWSLEDNSKQYGAQRALSLAKSWNPDVVIRWAKMSQASAQESKKLLTALVTQMDKNVKERSATRSLLQQGEQQFSSSEGLLGGAQKRFEAEAGKYLKKYTTPLRQALTSANGSQTQAKGYLRAATKLLPDDTSVDASGDPRSSADELAKAKVEIDKINTLAPKVTAGLDYQLTAMTKAAPTTKQAENSVKLANDHLKIIQVARQWSYEKALRKARNFYDQSYVSWIDAAKTLTSTIPSEGNKIDFPASYEAAQFAITNAANAIKEADRMTAVADYVANNIATYQQELTTAANQISVAESALTQLQTWHASHNWANEPSNLQASNVAYNRAKTEYATSLTQANIQQQQYDAAKASLDTAIADHRNAQDLAQQVISKLSQLEVSRQQAPLQISYAESSVNSARSVVNSLSAYSSNGVQRYNSAVTQLNQAYAARSGKDWPLAVTAATNAKSLADSAKQTVISDATATEVRHIEETRVERARETAVSAQATANERARIAAATSAAEMRAASATSSARAAEESRRAASQRSSSGSGYSSGGSSDNNSWKSHSSDNNAWKK